MNAMFVDTSGWASLVDSTQEFFELTSRIYHASLKKHTRLVTSNYVLTELVALLTSPMRISRSKCIDYIDDIKSSSFVDVVHINSELDERAWALLSQRADKKWSLVDCSSFVVMNDRGLVDALTTDHHFEQAGLVRLLK